MFSCNVFSFPTNSFYRSMYFVGLMQAPSSTSFYYRITIHGDPLTYWKHAHCIYFTEKAMAPHSSTLAWKIPWREEPGRWQSMGSWRVGQDWTTWLSLFAFTHWRRKWQPTPVFLLGESQGRGSLVSCRLWGCTESDTTEAAAAAVLILFLLYLFVLWLANRNLTCLTDVFDL